MARFTTLKTVWGFIVAVGRRISGVGKRSASIEAIYNYLKVDDNWATSGQPEAHEFELIRAAGFDCVINLAPSSALENSLKSEAELVDQLGMEYLHLPVNFAKPSEVKFAQFAEALTSRRQQRVWVHCAANMRVSAFTYRYRVAHEHEPEAEAKQRLNQIWHPKGVWQRFIDKAE